MVKTIDATMTDRLRRLPLYLDQSPSCARKRACMELTQYAVSNGSKIPLFYQCFRQRHVPTSERNRIFGAYFSCVMMIFVVGFEVAVGATKIFH